MMHPDGQTRWVSTGTNNSTVHKQKSMGNMLSNADKSSSTHTIILALQCTHETDFLDNSTNILVPFAVSSGIPCIFHQFTWISYSTILQRLICNPSAVLLQCGTIRPIPEPSLIIQCEPQRGEYGQHNWIYSWGTTTSQWKVNGWDQRRQPSPFCHHLHLVAVIGVNT